MHLGYQQQSTFCRVFREHYQRTPRQYRLQVQSGIVKGKAVFSPR
ncbi:AraC family transcriptional regulator [Kosakonia oryziphila]|nr:AraC family transcriptional regulator [Kosakonia oryziphila]